MSGNQESNIGQQPAQIANQGSGTKKRARRKDLTQKLVKELFDYNHETGTLTWRLARSNRIKVGDVVGSLGAGGYYMVNLNKIPRLVHRVIWLWFYGYSPEFHIDHINRVKTDNRIVNLREVGQSCNARNTPNFITNSSGVKGVSWFERDSKWRPRIQLPGGTEKTRTLGYHEDFTEAVAHRLAAEQCLEWEGCDCNSPAYQYMQNYLQELKCQKS